MKVYSRRFAAVVLAASLAIAPIAIASPQGRGGRDRDFGEKVVRIIKQIQKLFGVSSNDDLPLPPPPRP
jgi:hypothetical protein